MFSVASSVCLLVRALLTPRNRVGWGCVTSTYLIVHRSSILQAAIPYLARHSSQRILPRYSRDECQIRQDMGYILSLFLFREFSLPSIFEFCFKFFSRGGNRFCT